MQEGTSLNRLSFSATLHCLTGCAIGEVLGMTLATWWGWGDWSSIALAVALAFAFGYGLTISALMRAGLSLRQVISVAFAADTLSILTMEIVDNAVILLIPGAMDAGLASFLFWGALFVALAIAWVAAFPVNRWLIGRGMGHAVAHRHHASHG